MVHKRENVYRFIELFDENRESVFFVYRASHIKRNPAFKKDKKKTNYKQ